MAEPRILVVDDEADTRLNLCDILTEFGYQNICTQDGRLVASTTQEGLIRYHRYGS